MPSPTSSTVTGSSSEGRSIPREWLFSMDHDRPEPHHEPHTVHTHGPDQERKTFDDLDDLTPLRPPVRFGQRLKQLLRRPLFIANPTPSPLPTLVPNTPGYEAPFPLPTPAAQATTAPTPAPAYPKSPQDASYFPPVVDSAAAPNAALPNPSAWHTQPAYVVTPPGAPPTPGGAFIVTTQTGAHHAHTHATPIVLPPGKVTITLTLPSAETSVAPSSVVGVTGPCACGDRYCVGGSLQTARQRRRAAAACACGDSSCPAGARRVHDVALPPASASTSASASASSSSSPARAAGPSSPLACHALHTCSPLSVQSRRVRIHADETKDTVKADKDEKRDRGGRRAGKTDEQGARRRRPSKAKDMTVEVAFEPVR